MTRPSAAQIAFARSTLPVRRVASTAFGPSKPTAPFASVLRTASTTAATSPAGNTRAAHPPVQPAAATYKAPLLAAPSPATFVADGPAVLSRSEIINNARALMDVPYVWGGTSASGLDCSAFISKAWGVGRHTTDNLSAVAVPISKDELQSGDALNLTTIRDSDGTGHVRLFDRWANAERTRMYVYEETPPRSLYHVISWDPHYTPMRRHNIIDA